MYLLGKVDEVANLVDSSLIGKRVERPPPLRGGAESSCSRDIGARCRPSRKLKRTATAWAGEEGDTLAERSDVQVQ